MGVSISTIVFCLFIFYFVFYTGLKLLKMSAGSLRMRTNDFFFFFWLESTIHQHEALSIHFISSSSLGFEMSLSATFASPVTSLSVAGSEDQCQKQKKNACFIPAGLQPLHLHFQPFRNKESASSVFRVKYTSICAASLNATCAAQQTQTVTRQSSTITVAPIQWKEKSRELDDGGTGLPPLDYDGGVGDRGGGDDDDGGGGSGGGGHWSGRFFFFAFLAFLSFLKDQENEEPYGQEMR